MCMTRLLLAPKVPNFEGQRVSLHTLNRRYQTPPLPSAERTNSKDLKTGHGRGTTRAEDAQGTPTQSHISPSIQVYEDYLAAFGGRQTSFRISTSRFRGGLVVKAHRLLYHSALGLRVMKKKKEGVKPLSESRPRPDSPPPALPFGVWGLTG